MSKDTEQEFEELAERTSQEAARILCSVGEYQSGLRTIIYVLQTDLRASQEMSGDQEEE